MLKIRRGRLDKLKKREEKRAFFKGVKSKRDGERVSGFGRGGGGTKRKKNARVVGEKKGRIL